MKWRHLLLLICLTSTRTVAAGDSRPNILLIVADDLGFSDLGCYGGEIQTPNLDRLAADGIRFTQFYNCSVCNVTRAAMMTGLHPRFGKAGLLRPNMATIPELLRQAGYSTSMSGKWHLGGAPNRPTDRGFDEFYGVMIGAVNHFDPTLPDPPGMKHAGPAKPFVHNVTPITHVPNGYYTTDAFADHAVQQIHKLSKGARPYFLHLAFTAPHYPLMALPEDIAKYRGRYEDGYTELRRERYRRLVEMQLISKDWNMPDPDPSVGVWRYDLSPKEWELVADPRWEAAKMEVYAAMVDRMDQAIGRVLAAVKETGAEEQTLVVFMSDNGACGSESSAAAYKAYQAGVETGSKNSYILGGSGWAYAQSSPFRRFKTWTYEGGISTPMIIRWPGNIRQNGLSHAVAHVVDLMPTFLSAATVAVPEQFHGQPLVPLEGVDLMPLLLRQESHNEREIGWYLYGSRAYRSGKWKLVWGVTTKRWELYDMEVDRTETSDLADAHPDIVSELVSKWQTWAKRSELP
jgi:arylsulfatase